MSRARALAALPVLLVGCSAQYLRGPSPAPLVVPAVVDHESGEPSIAHSAWELDGEIVARSEERVAQLKERGGECAVYGAVLESSVRDRKVSVRPYMWRVGGRLVSGEARPSGDIIVAREIDALNVGVRTVEDVLWSLEHEAAHIAFRVANGGVPEIDGASAWVRACR